MTPTEVKADVELWSLRLQSIGLRTDVRYSQADRSVYLQIPLKLPDASYPRELLQDMETIGIRLLGASSATLDGAGATMGLVGADITETVVQSGITSYITPPAPTTPPIDVGGTITAQSTTIIVYTPNYLSLASVAKNSSSITGPIKSQTVLPTGIALMRTSDWSCTPLEYRTLWPDDARMGTVPEYRKL